MPPPPTPSPLATDIESVVSEDCAMALISALEQHLPDQSFPDTIASSGFTVTPRASYPDARPAFRVYFNFMDVSSDDGVSVDYDSDGEIANADSYPDGMTKSVVLGQAPFTPRSLPNSALPAFLLYLRYCVRRAFAFAAPRRSHSRRTCLRRRHA
ncbi:hypothetical protein CYMTET_51188 [Cymbomonas tetramitiformis]|uniref:Uncharacterized protein n=1 Tax=Cymbomonas tetramitiformis TaxID=36881 RepID=A0AAE0BLS0_9CHLO|nr:hypothetical protein CYMTET_51188 [Cymbomonas tetramitiformis]